MAERVVDPGGKGSSARWLGAESRDRSPGLSLLCAARTPPRIAPTPPPCYDLPEMRRFATLLLAALFLLGALHDMANYIAGQ